MRIRKQDSEKQHPYAEIIRKYRIDHDLSLEQFGIRCGCSENIVWRWEHGISDPRNTTLEYVREAFPDFVKYEKACPYIKVFKTNFVDTIKAFRKSKNLTRLDFAKAINVPYSTICNWEYGMNEPRVHNMDAIKKAFPDFEEWENNYENS